MHRMRQLASLGLLLALAALADRRADADPIRPTAPTTYPAIAADFDGSVSYTYDAASRRGRFQLANTPLLLAAGPTVAAEATIRPTGAGVRSQVLDVALDPNGQLLASPTNTYELYGTVVAGGQTYTGLLLKGVPTAFGSQAHDPLDARSNDVFDLNLKVTGGQLASAFGPDAYMQVVPRCDSTFAGSFQHDFAGMTPASTVRAEHAPSPMPIPEPAALAVLLAGGCGLALRRMRR